MNSRRTFLLGLPILTTGVACAQSTQPLAVDGVDSAKTIDELKQNIFFKAQWREASFAKQRFVFALTRHGYGESYIDLHGWIYNQYFKEWRRFLKINTRKIGRAKLLIDEKTGVLSLQGADNNDLKDVEVFRFDLRTTSDDSGYEKLR